MVKHENWLTDPVYIQLVEFIVEKTKNVKEPISNKALGREFKTKSGSELSVDCLISRVRRFRQIVHELPHLDNETKVRMMFGLSVTVDSEFLEKLKKEAEVVTVDEYNRIIHYKKGGLELYGIHPPKNEPRIAENQNYEWMLNLNNQESERNDKDVEEIHGDSSDGEWETMDVTTRSGRVSKKRLSDAFIYNNQYDIGSSSTQNETSSNNPSTSNKRRKTSETPTTGSLLVPKDEEMLMDVKMEDDPNIHYFPNPNGIKNEQNEIPNSSEDVVTTTEDYIPEDSSELTLILGALNDFIDSLDLPILSGLQKKIEAKLEECKDRNEMIPNNEINLSLELCFSKVARSHLKSSENNESMSLKELLSLFRLAVKTMKCSALVDFEYKLRRVIGELRVQDKNVQMTTIRGALQNTIDNLITS